MEVIDAGEKRRRLNLLKCKQCRDARKKCFPVDRVWPQKCDRCLHHRPESLECSEPVLNTRTRERLSLLSKPPAHSISLTTLGTPEPRVKKHDDDNLSDNASTYDRPLRCLKKGIKRERSSALAESQVREREDYGSSDNASVYDRPAPTPVVPAESVPETQPSHISKEVQRPASTYLPLAEGEFRILQLDPGPREDKITCSFVTASKNQPLKYETISYLWGALQSSKEIQLRDPLGKLHSIYIRSNIYNALRSLRHPKVTRSFWVDALCINYSNPDSSERNRLVAMKLYIFNKAENHCFWIGEDANSKAALNFIPSILNLRSINKLIQDDEAIDNWCTFISLLKTPVFSRLWLVQEVAVAQNTTLHAGQAAIHYKDLVDAMAIFMSFRNDISLLFRRNQKNYKELFDRKITIAERFINVSTNALRVTNSGKIERRISLEALVSQLKDLSTTNPLDRIYSVLAIARDGPPLEEDIQVEHDRRSSTALSIDYDKSILELYQDFVIRTIERSKSLDIICRSWASSVSSLNLPTWVHPLSASLPIRDIDISERIYADSLVGLPGQNQYNASKGTVAHFRLGLGQSDDSPKSLFVHGFRIDTISRLGPRAEDGIILHEWLELGDVVGEIVPEAFWRTLVADRSANGSVAPSWYSRAFLCCLGLSPTGNINTNRLIDESEAQPFLTVDFLPRVQSVIWNRKFLVSKENGWIGLAPIASQVGDFICILNGCTVPVVLRLQEDIDGKEFFRLVGECYVHGMMDGEAAEIAMAIEEDIEIR